MADNDITPAIILEYLRAMEQRLRDELKKEIRKEITASEERTKNVILASEARLTLQIDGIDKRLDDIEVFQIPKLKKVTGIS